MVKKIPFVLSDPNSELIKKANRIGWRKVNKIDHVYAKKVRKETVIKTLEGIETGDRGNILVIAKSTGEPWLMTNEDRLNKEYEKVTNEIGKIVIKTSKEIVRNVDVLRGEVNLEKKGDTLTYVKGFAEYKPKKRERYAVQMMERFEVKHLWGDPWNGEKGDYLVTSGGVQEGDKEWKRKSWLDIWVVKRSIFKGSYR